MLAALVGMILPILLDILFFSYFADGDKMLAPADSGCVLKCHEESLLPSTKGLYITVMPLLFSSIPQGALTAHLKYAYLDFVSVLRSVKSRVNAGKKNRKNGRESEMRFKGTRPANGRKDSEMELREKMENVAWMFRSRDQRGLETTFLVSVSVSVS